MSVYSIGVDIGGTKVTTVVMDENHHIVSQNTIPTMANLGYQNVFNRIIEEIEQIKKPFETQFCIGIGVGSPGPLDYKTGTIYSPPNLPGWDEIPLKNQLENYFGLPVWVDNDANLAALAEWKFGAGLGTNHMLYITVSTGIGAGIVLNRELYRGFTGNAGEIGQMLIQVDGDKKVLKNLESLSSGTAIRTNAFKQLGKDFSAKQVAERSSSDEGAKQVLSEAFYYLGVCIANLTFFFNPERIVIGGGLSNLKDELIIPIEEIVNQYVPLTLRQKVKIVPAELGALSGAIGAAIYPFLQKK